MKRITVMWAFYVVFLCVLAIMLDYADDYINSAPVPILGERDGNITGLILGLACGVGAGLAILLVGLWGTAKLDEPAQTTAETKKPVPVLPEETPEALASELPISKEQENAYVKVSELSEA